MAKRLIFFVPAAIVAAPFSTAIEIGATKWALAASDCIEQPNRPAAPGGGHWFYRTDSVNNRKCWHLVEPEASLPQAEAPKGGAVYRRDLTARNHWSPAGGAPTVSAPESDGTRTDRRIRPIRSTKKCGASVESSNGSARRQNRSADRPGGMEIKFGDGWDRLDSCSACKYDIVPGKPEPE